MVEPNIPQKLYDFPDQLPIKTYAEIVQEIQNGLVPHGAGISPRKTLQSTNFVEGATGWRIDTNGNVEFQNGIFRGSFSIGGTVITIDNTDDIQTRLDEIDAAGGGTLYLQNGIYTLTADISIPTGVTLEGVTRDGVIIDCDNSYAVTIAGTNPYTTGSIAISDGDTTVVGSGTTFTSGMVGRYIYLDGLWYEITVFTDTTHIDIGTTYAGTNLSGYAYAIADPNFNSIIRKLTITNATAGGLEITYASEPWIDDLIIYDCGTGLDLDYVVFPKIFVLSDGNGVGMNMNFVSGFKVDFCSFSFSTTGAGVVLTNVTSSTFFDSAVDQNTGDGINVTNCDNITFLSFTANNNGGQGVEFVSGVTNCEIVSGDVSNNTSDGVKLTATTDRCTIVASSITDNGGYGVNIAASTCDNNQIIAPAFDSNSSGNINDSGTNTFVSPQETLTGIINLFSTSFEATGRLVAFGTDDATTTLGINGLDMSAGASQNAGRAIQTQIGQSLATGHSIVGFQFRPRNGEGSGEVCYVGVGENTPLTISDSAITYTSRSNYGVKIIGDGTNIDIWATNANRSGTETATEIYANATPTEVVNLHAMEYIGGTSIIWRSFDGTALATHTTNLPTTAMTSPTGQVIVTQNTQIWVPAFSLSMIF